MNISKVGLDLILSFEGKLKLLPDGRYKAYRCPAGVWTIYAGCTEGVREGMIVTEAEGETMFRKEIAKFEAGVMRLVTCEMTQPQFDALVSFAYNCGLGALASSSLLKRFNAGDIDGAAKGFAPWNKATVYDRKLGKRVKVVLRGLVRRRAAEMALFLSQPEPAPETEVEPEMPQAVEASPEKPSRPTVGAGGVVAGGTGAVVAIEAAKQVTDQAKEVKTIAKDTRDLIPPLPPMDSFVWPALILAAGLIGAVLLYRRARA